MRLRVAWLVLFYLCSQSSRAQVSPLNFITPATLPEAMVSSTYTVQLQASGGQPGYVFAAEDALPPGLSLSPAGLLSGRPLQAREDPPFSFTVRVTDCNGVAATACRPQSVTRRFTLVVVPALTITNPSLAEGAACQNYSQTMSATGGRSPYRWSASNLPPGLSMSSAGTISGMTAQSGQFNVRIQVEDSRERFATRDYVLTIQPLRITTTSLPGGVVGVAYNATLTSTGGSRLSWSVAGGSLPPGLGLSTTATGAGLVSGTPTTAGTFNTTYRVSDAAGCQATASLPIVIQQRLQITTSSINPAQVGASYTQTFTATGGTPPLAWSVTAGNLPPGLSLSTAGVLSGVPTTAGNYTFTITVRDGREQVDSRSFTLSVSVASLEITTESLAPGAVGRPYQQNLSATGGVTPYRWVALTALPPGLSFGADGVISGTPTQAGSFSVSFRVSDASNQTATRSYVLLVTGAFTITTPALSTGLVNANYNQTISTTGGRSPITFQVLSGSLPPGLSLSPTTGAITGVATQAGEFTFTIRAVDADQQMAERTFTITIQGQFRITTDALPTGEVGTTYNVTLAVTGGRSPFSWSVVEGALPSGLGLNPTTGVLSGVPGTAGRFTFTVQVVDAGGQTARQPLTVLIVARLTLETDALPRAVAGAFYTQTFQATGGEPPYRWSISGETPPGLSLDLTSGVLSGTPSRVGSYRFTVQVQDRANRSASRSLVLDVSSGLTISLENLPVATVGLDYRVSLTASGVTGALTWSISGSLPDGLTFNSATGVISGTPRASGAFPITISVRDASGASDSRSFSLQVNPLVLPAIVISPENVELAGQPAVSITFRAPAPATLTGTLTLSFTAEGGGDNPQVQFSSGGRTATFTIPAGQTQASFGASGLSLQVSNVAGVITLTTRLSTAAGVDVTPSPAPTRTLQIPRSAPVITAITARRSANALTVEVVGYSSTREVATAEVQFTAAPGSNVQGTSLTVPVTTAFSTWYQDSRSREFGSAFTLTLPFTVSGDASAITGVSVTLVNGAGRSTPRSANF
ncbi:MAG: putative Ig domain-containing protein [Bryobacteraceae bacterium]|nr:putative Ig domain-containing protein [Bryobacteraceae bacterium]MDW8379696.1 putative Ig domain-containing protein [Bryobacterales bacterium]